MALDATRLRDSIDTKLAALLPDYASSTSRDAIKTGLMQAIAEAVVEEITTNARATGTDTPTGDTHDLVIE